MTTSTGLVRAADSIQERIPQTLFHHALEGPIAAAKSLRQAGASIMDGQEARKLRPEDFVDLRTQAKQMRGTGLGVKRLELRKRWFCARQGFRQ